MLISIIGLIPEIFNSFNEYGIVKKAIKKKVLSINYINIRNFTKNNYHSVDDKPYGGGSSMVIKFDPVYQAISYAKKNTDNKTRVIYLSPQGKKINQNDINRLSDNKHIIIICGRYKGIDERLIIKEVNEELSIGDYIISNGELAAMILIDAMCRILPNIIRYESLVDNSFHDGLLSYPQYTRPKVINNMSVPQVLLSGDHNKINKWKLKQSIGRTFLRRPDLLNKITLSNEQKQLLLEFKKENNLIL
ncbi:MAG: tRNA (guanosine(37)-N1)-methyltransferase TrmD [Candidatus Lightella neohaematopini]|nr:tRNA (guanosine(37)-N1)-methyltransferase TrmD [Candidatus Lightella neohaematopini]MCV2528651.1 tRNA (guanosine(37)-N1)-methyltransferase TrmD [Candidatus Lightella neohaematopini]